MLFELWCWRRLLRVPWTARRSNQSILKETSWVFIGRTDAEAETPIFWPPNAKSWLFGKDPDAGRDWGQEEKETTEDEMAGWHHRLDAHEFGWTPGVGDGQGGLACCDSWSRKASDTTERLNWTEDVLPKSLSMRNYNTQNSPKNAYATSIPRPSPRGPLGHVVHAFGLARWAPSAFFPGFGKDTTRRKVWDRREVWVT